MLVWRHYKGVILLLGFLTLVGCAHRQAMKRGDEYFEQGAYQEALNAYRQAQEKKPSSEDLRERIDRAEEELVQVLLGRLEDGAADGDVEDAISGAGHGAQWIHSEIRRQRLGDLSESIVLEEGNQRLGGEDYEGALSVIELHMQYFGEGSQELEALQILVRYSWLRELEALANEYDRAGLLGARALILAQADHLGFDDRYRNLAVQAVAGVREREGWAVHISGNVEPGILEATTSRIFQADLPEGIRDGRRAGGLARNAQVRFVRSEPVFDFWEESDLRSGEYQSGTQLLPNPAYQREEERLFQAEQRLSEAERELTRAYRDARNAERDLRERQRRGQSTSYEQSRVDRAYRDADRWEVESENRSREVDHIHRGLRSIAQYEEHPVYSEHFYEATLQNGRLRSSLRLDLIVADQGFGRSFVTEIVEEAQTERYLPQPVLGLPGRQEAPPTRQELEAAYLESVKNYLVAFIQETFEAYRYERVANISGLGKDEQIDRLATFILLDPAQRDHDLEARLNELSGLGYGAALLLRGDW